MRVPLSLLSLALCASLTSYSPALQGSAAPAPACPSQKNGTVTSYGVRATGTTQAEAESNLQWGGYDDDLMRHSGLVCGTCIGTIKCEWWVDSSVTFTPTGSNKVGNIWVAHGEVTGTYTAHCGDC